MNRTAFYYDNRSNLKCVLDPDNGLTYYTYDALNRMTSVKNPWGELTQYAYSPGGRLLKRVLGNGTIAYYAYDAVGQVSKVQNVKSNLTTISSFEYQRNALGSPVSIKREDNSVTYYEYDAKQQLTKETQVNGQGQQVYGWTWDYDLAGNRLHQTFNGVTTAYTYNAGNELTQETTAGATTYFSYDHNGNTTAKIEPGATTQYHWDRENLMTQVDLPTGGHNYFAYDADGKRVEKRDGDGYTRFIYEGPDMLKLLQERDQSDTRQAQYTMGNGLEAMRRGSTSSFYHYDWLGSTFELTNAAATVTDTYLYNAWGEVLNQTGTTVNPHLYVGRERYCRALAAGLYLLGLRHYASAAGRFVSVDPLRQGTVWYQYASASPAFKADPPGLYVTGPIVGPNALEIGFDRGFVYTCACGWLDLAHLMHTRNNVLKMATALAGPEWGQAGPFSATLHAAVEIFPLSASVGFSWSPPAPQQEQARRHIAAYIAYLVRYEYENRERGFGFSYEDLPSNWLGALVGGGFLDLKQVARLCGAVDHDVAQRIYDEMEWTTLVTAAPHHGLKNHPSSWSSNPLSGVHLFHRDYPSTRGCCQGIAAPGVRSPAALGDVLFPGQSCISGPTFGQVVHPWDYDIDLGTRK